MNISYSSRFNKSYQILSIQGKLPKGGVVRGWEVEEGVLESAEALPIPGLLTVPGEKGRGHLLSAELKVKEQKGLQLAL